MGVLAPGIGAQSGPIPHFFNQKPDVLKFVPGNPPDRVAYGDLRIIRAEFEELVQLSIEAGTISHPIPYEKYVDESFIQNVQPVQITLEKGAQLCSLQLGSYGELLPLASLPSFALRMVSPAAAAEDHCIVYNHDLEYGV
jgi:hypothetical protein